MKEAKRLEAVCRHCGVIYPSKPGVDFCCQGCEFAFDLIHQQGLNGYYELKKSNPPLNPSPVKPTRESYAFCDDPLYIKTAGSDGEHFSFYLEGLNCTACLWLLEKLPEYCADAATARVNMAESTIEVTRREGGSFSAIARTLNSLGHRPHPLSSRDDAAVLKRQENRKTLVRIGLAAACTGNIMILAVSLYAGAGGSLAEQFRWLTALLSAPVLTYCAWPFYRNAFGALKNGHLNIDVPIVAALVAGVIAGFWGLVGGFETVYFDSLSMLVLLLLSSRYYLSRIQQNHLNASNLEDLLLIGSASRVSALGVETVSSLSLKKGDVIAVSEGLLPVDGYVSTGEGMIHTAVLTGESTAIKVKPGDFVEAGSIVLQNSWRLRVSDSAKNSRLAKILKDTERAASHKPRAVLVADRVAQWFIGLVLCTAIALVLFFGGSDPAEGISRALALVIVTCPCVFGMAIPLSVSLAIRSAARHGMVIKSADVIERLAKIKNLYFDKTGTVTLGDLHLVGVQVDEDHRRYLAAIPALEDGQPHPVARALIHGLKSWNLEFWKATDVQLNPSGGICGRCDGVDYSILPIDGVGLHAIYGLFQGDRLIAQLETGDQLRAEAPQLIQWAKAKGLRTVLISGDKRAIVNECGRQLGLAETQMISEASPEKKARIISDNAETSVMIGDGANDAAALASSSIGIAVRGSMSLSLRAADVYLTQPDLTAVRKLFEIAERTRATIKRNLIFSGSFNLISGTLAISGLMSPLWAAVLMPTSSLIVLVSAWKGRQ